MLTASHQYPVSNDYPLPFPNALANQFFGSDAYLDEEQSVLNPAVRHFGSRMWSNMLERINHQAKRVFTTLQEDMEPVDDQIEGLSSYY